MIDEQRQQCTDMERESFNKHVKEHMEERLIPCARAYAHRWFKVFDGLAETPEIAAEMLFNDSYVQAYKTRATFDPNKGSFPGWFCTIMYYVVLDKYRVFQAKNQSGFSIAPLSLCDEDAVGMDGIQNSPTSMELLDFLSIRTWSDQELQMMAHLELIQFFETLNSQDREIFSLLFEGYTKVDIARKLDLPYQSLLLRVHHIFKQFRMTYQK